MIYDRIKIKRLIQSTGYLLSLTTKKQMNYTKLLKLLYIADREALSRWDSTITGDRYSALTNGPILSKVYDLIRNRCSNDYEQCKWDIYFNTNEYDLELHNNISTDELSEAEEELLLEIYNKFKGYDWKKMIQYVHNKKNIPEYNNPENTSIPIPIEDILKKLGRDNKEIKNIIKEMKSHEKEHEFLINNFA